MIRHRTIWTLLLAALAIPAIAIVARSQTTIHADSTTAPSSTAAPATAGAVPTSMMTIGPTTSDTSGDRASNRGFDNRRGGFGRTGYGSVQPQTTSTASTTAPAVIGGSHPPAENFQDRYAVITERNIFVRDRVRPLPPGSNTGRTFERPTPPPPSLESLLALRGITLDGDTYHAYFENTQTNEMLRVAAGDTLAHGRVGEISVESVEYDGERSSFWVNVGDNLAGMHIAPTTGPTTGPAGGSTATGTTASGTPLSAIEERMRQQRLQRTGGR